MSNGRDDVAQTFQTKNRMSPVFTAVDKGKTDLGYMVTTIRWQRVTFQIDEMEEIIRIDGIDK